MSNEDIKVRLEVVKELTQVFRLERLVHLIVTCVALIVLLAVAVKLIYKNQAGSVELTLMFGSSGLITYSASRLLYMWNQALSVIVSEHKKDENESQ